MDIDTYEVVSPAKITNYPFDADTERMLPFMFENYGELDEQEYIERELICTGIDEFGEAYKTIAMVRIPSDPTKFSGVLIAEPFHVCPMLPLYVYTAKAILRGNHGWVGICGKKSTMEHSIVEANPQRYADLHITAGPCSKEEQQLDFTAIPNTPQDGEPWYQAFLRYNRADNSILAQVGAALKHGDGLPEGYDVQHILLGGHSFTGFTVTRYIQNAHARIRMSDGGPIYDGFFPSGWPSFRLHATDVPIIQTVTAADICMNNEAPYRYQYDPVSYRREDSDADDDRYRLYEFPGFGHASMQFPPTNEVDFVLSFTQPPLIVPDGSISSTLPFVEYHAAALDRLIRWITDGTIPSREERMVCDETDSPDFFQKDAHGNTLGGVRCPQMDVPTAVYLSNTYNEDGSVRFGGNGFEVPFSNEQLRALYGTPENYRIQYAVQVQRSVEAGWLFPEDAQLLIEQAEALDF